MIKLKSLIQEIKALNKIKIPDEPGTVPIPSDHIRFFHYTKAMGNKLDDLKTKGILVSHATGNEGPKGVIWASTKLPDTSKTVVEFSMKYDDERLVWPGILRKLSPHDAMQRENHANFYGDILPNEFIAVHEYWHKFYRYLLENDLIQQTLNGKFDHITPGNHYEEYTAIQAIKMNFEL